MAVHMSAIDRHVVLPLDAADASLDACGGKGLNLSRLARAGFAVPPGFVLATRAYRSFVVANNLGPRISAACQALDASDAAGLEAASAAIRAAFVESVLPPEIEEAVRSAWSEAFTPDTAVAVRSSATAEDLPDLSFAGQQDTFLTSSASRRLSTPSCAAGRASGPRVRSATASATGCRTTTSPWRSSFSGSFRPR